VLLCACDGSMKRFEAGLVLWHGLVRFGSVVRFRWRHWSTLAPLSFGTTEFVFVCDVGLMVEFVRFFGAMWLGFLMNFGLDSRNGHVNWLMDL